MLLEDGRIGPLIWRLPVNRIWRWWLDESLRHHALMCQAALDNAKK
jgi:hypothetical protein